MNDHIIKESNADYHARDSISASRLKMLRDSPRKYEADVIKRRIKRTETPAMKMGTAIHAAILEPDTFNETYTTCPEECSDRRTKAYKEWATTAGDRTVLSLSENATVCRAWQAVTSHPIAGKIVGGTDYAEGSILYQDDETGADCRFRFDGIAGQVVYDIKTIAECSQRDIEKAIFTYGYHIQAAHYLAGLSAITPAIDWRFLFIFVETSEPFRCRVVELSDLALEWGFDERRSLIADLTKRTESGDWSDPGENEVCSVFVPNWYKGVVTV